MCTVQKIEQDFATLLREWRCKQRLSQDELATRSALSRSTISRWERGTHQPCLAELGAVLRALGATPEQSALARRSIAAPRMQESATSSPVGGDLLRAMRRRQHRTQDEVARAIGVPRATLARWETSEAWPDASQLHQLCRALQAHPDEVAALTRGRFSPLTSLWQGDEITQRFPDVYAFESHVYAVRIACSPADQVRLRDLHFILRLEGLSHYGAASSVQQAMAYTSHAQFLMDHGRLTEAAHYATLALRLADTHRLRDPALRVPSLLALAERDVYGDGLAFEERRRQTLGDDPRPRFSFGRGIRRLREVAQTEQDPEYATWILAHLARYASGAGRHREAITYADRALSVIPNDGKDRSSDIQARKQLQSRVYSRSGQTQAIL
jgi:transcriptional regulator with XRE-family HTH domain